MNLVRVAEGHIVNLAHVVEWVRDGAGPGCDRIVLTPGRAVDLDAEESYCFRRALGRVVPPRPGGPRIVHGRTEGA